MEADWTGGTLPIKDLITGKTVPAYLFVGVLPCSCYVYAELCSDMKSENWLLCHVHAYEYFSGVPRLTIPDHLRTGVLKNTRMETILNRSYSELADHYGTAVVPARVHRLQDKSHAEGSVSYASTWILAALRNETSFSLADAKEAVAKSWKNSMAIPLKNGKETAETPISMRKKNSCSHFLSIHMNHPSGRSRQSLLIIL